MKKFAPYILIIFLVLVGLFSPTGEVSAQGIGPLPACIYTYTVGGAFANNAPCVDAAGTQLNSAAPVPGPPAPSTATDPFQQSIDNGCSLWPQSFSLSGCLLYLFYYTYFQLPTFILWLAAQLFNVFISIGISSTMTASSTFISNAWAVVRDLSNIFFILILLYIAVQTILGIGHETKKMIVRVIIMALLINFSMFFTKIVIDTSNILALVFYNKLDISTVRPNTSLTPNKEKDIAGEMHKAFNGTKLLNQEFLNQLKEETGGRQLPFALTFGMIIISGSLMLWAAYALFVSSFMFLGRLIELWVLIIFSPFAFMSRAIPLLSRIDYIGWDSWSKRLLATSFMAPIFMFFMYLIFLLLPLIFGSFITGTGFASVILGVLIPGLIIIALLLKAAQFAKKGGGQFGELAMSGAKLVTGLAIGAATGGAALAGRAVVGGVAKSVQSSAVTRRNAFTFKDTRDKWNKGGFINRAGAVRSAIGGVGKAATAGTAALMHILPTGGGKTLGTRVQGWDKGYSEKTHATSILDQKAKSEFGHQPGYENVKYKDLKESEQKGVRKEVDKDAIAKVQYGSNFTSLEANEKKAVMLQYDAGTRAIKHEDGTPDTVDANAVTTNPTTGVTTAAARAHGEGIASDVIEHDSKSSVAIGEFVQALRKGSYDIRNLPDMSIKSKGLLLPKLGFGSITMIAAGVRLGLKKTGGIEYGTPQKDILKDIKNTIGDALKNVKINISGGGGGGGGGDHGTKEVKSVGH